MDPESVWQSFHVRALSGVNVDPCPPVTAPTTGTKTQKRPLLFLRETHTATLHQ